MYFKKFLALEGELKDGDMYIVPGMKKAAQVKDFKFKEKDAFRLNAETKLEVLINAGAKPAKEFMCSKNMKEGDRVWNTNVVPWKELIFSEELRNVYGIYKVII